MSEVRFNPPEREQADEGPTALAVAVITDLGMMVNTFNKNNHVIEIGFLTQHTSSITGQLVPITQRFNMVYGERALLLAFYRACVNNKTAYIPKGFDFQQLIGVNLRGSVVHRPKPDGGYWANLGKDFWPADPASPRIVVPSIAYPPARPQNPPDIEAKVQASIRSTREIYSQPSASKPPTSEASTQTSIRDMDRTAFVTTGPAVEEDPFQEQ
jgi:hypothetical protein